SNRQLQQPLARLVDGLDVKLMTGDISRASVTNLAYDSRRVQPGGLFFALPGIAAHGISFLDQAVARGAVAVLSDQAVDQEGVVSLVSPDPRLVMAQMAARFFGYPTERLKVVGVTGTNGKTTTSFLIKHLLDHAHQRCGLIGTVHHAVADRIQPASRTTPEAVDLQSLFAQMVAAGCRTAAIEVSSIALDQKRVEDVRFEVGVFTNLTQDHLDYHGTMERYFQAKLRLFEMMAERGGGMAVVNLDDSHGSRLLARFERKLKLVTYGAGTKAMVRGSDVKSEFGGTTFRLDAEGRSFLVRMQLIGRFNLSNALAALATVSALGLNLREAVKSLENCEGAPGRLQAVPGKRLFRVFVDYAHTPDALLNVLRTLRELNPSRLTCVFGCGGDRDKGKRPLMGRVADLNADFTIITSDNPRSESPRAIIKDVEAGFHSGDRYRVVEDRREAIFDAIMNAERREIVLIAGKGHETYQEFADRTLPFDDFQVAKWALEARAVARAAEEDERM
ncbi:MAG: UDP-N-acetylmuramoyl-L-alanyl-D-glutamate--2,6-diaminopimelate ligase, partial [Verrucomicrobiia bacterium]